jgi:hypothetical protein
MSDVRPKAASALLFDQGGKVQRFISIPLAAFACLAVGIGTASANTNPVLYSSLPEAGTVSIPSVGVEAYSFNQIGNEVILTRRATAHHVSVTMVDWACQHGAWNTGDCITTPGTTYPTTITLTLYRASTTNSSTGEVTPGTPITHIMRTCNIKFRPSSNPTCGMENGVVTEFRGSDGQCHHGLDQTVVFPISRKAGGIRMPGGGRRHGVRKYQPGAVQQPA